MLLWVVLLKMYEFGKMLENVAGVFMLARLLLSLCCRCSWLRLLPPRSLLLLVIVVDVLYQSWINLERRVAVLLLFWRCHCFESFSCCCCCGGGGRWCSLVCLRMAQYHKIGVSQRANQGSFVHVYIICSLGYMANWPTATYSLFAICWLDSITNQQYSHLAICFPLATGRFWFWVLGRYRWLVWWLLVLLAFFPPK